MQSHDPKALPCPFCGGKPVTYTESGDERNAYADRRVYMCSGCGVSVYVNGDTSKPGYANNSKIGAQALAKWNTRTK